MKILIIDYNGPRREKIVSRIRNLDIEKKYIEEIRHENGVKEKNGSFIDTTNYGLIFLHGSKNQSDVKAFFEKKCIDKLTIVYTGGDISDFAEFESENPKIHFKITNVGSGDEKWFRVEDFIKENFIKETKERL